MTNGSFGVDRVGVHAAGEVFARWGWAFRELHESDFGIDVMVEPFTGGRPSGRYVALQVKSGRSWFSRKVSGGWVFRERHTRHLHYWLSCCLPVVLLLHDPDSGKTYWEQVTRDKAKVTGAGWKMVVPAEHVLCADAAGALQAISDSAPGAAVRATTSSGPDAFLRLSWERGTEKDVILETSEFDVSFGRSISNRVYLPDHHDHRLHGRLSLVGAALCYHQVGAHAVVLSGAARQLTVEQGKVVIVGDKERLHFASGTILVECSLPYICGPTAGTTFTEDSAG